MEKKKKIFIYYLLYIYPTKVTPNTPPIKRKKLFKVVPIAKSNCY